MSSHGSLQVLLARIAGTQTGFSASAVHEIVRAVAIAPLPGAPGIIEGVINLHGRVVPVVDVRKRLSLPAEPLAPEQFIVVLQLSDRLIAVRVDDVEDVIDVPVGSLEPSSSLSPVLAGLDGIAALSDGALVIHDADAFLSQAEREVLDHASAVGSE